MKILAKCQSCHKLYSCKVAGASENVVKEFCPIVLQKRRDEALKGTVVFIDGQQPKEIIDVIQKALNENKSMN